MRIALLVLQYLCACSTAVFQYFMQYSSAVSPAAVGREAAELEMQTERYVHGLQEALMGGGASAAYCFTLTPSPPSRGSSVTLGYEKVQRDLSVSGAADGGGLMVRPALNQNIQDQVVPFQSGLSNQPTNQW